MKVLIVGSGGREHALTWAIARSPSAEHVYVAPGNAGTQRLGTNVDIKADDVDALAAFARREHIDLTVVGPEAPLMAGIVDRFAAEGLPCYGPRRDAARLEGSKVFAKEFMRRHAIPTADFQVFEDPGAAREHVESVATPVVIKADGLAAGKGVIVATDRETARAAIDDMMVARRFGDAGCRVVVEECLAGDEVSVHAVCAGERCILMPSSQDHKRAHDGDTGPNTGGMGAIAPVPSFSATDMEWVRGRIIEPALRGLAAEGTPFAGTLYAGLMRTADGPKVLEFNVRFGDPETEVLLPLIESDFLELLAGASAGELPSRVAFHDGRSAATVVMASAGYPGAYEKGRRIDGLDSAEEGSVVFHAGTRRDGAATVTSGGRVLAVTAWDNGIAEALTRAYRAVSHIHFDGAFWRSDIGARAVGNK